MHGLFSFFKKKPAPRAVVKDETTTRHESFCDVNELMPDETKMKVQPPAEAPRSKKKFAAPTAPESRPDVAARSMPEEPIEIIVETPREEESTSEAPAKQERSENMPRKTVEDKKMSPQEEKPSAVHVHEVIHYSPQSTVRSHVVSPPPDSDVPYVERKSNIVLNDKSGRKTIPVTQFDGTISKPREKKVAAPPPPVPATPPPPLASSPQPLSASAVKTSSFSNDRETESMRKTPSPNSGPRQQLSDEDNEEVKNAAEITHEYETLKAKFDLWQALQAENRNSSEARQLHMEIIYQHDSLMKKLQQTTDIALPSGKSRPSIASDTFKPWSANSSPKLPQNSRNLRKLEAKRPAALPARWTPTPSAHSLSPATSTSSEETTRSQSDGRMSRAIVTDRLVATGPLRGTYNKQPSSSNDERERALLRIVEEANELKRREQELRGSAGYAAANNSALFASTSRNEVDRRRGPAVSTPNTLPKHIHSRGSSDGNNNSISTASRRTGESTYATPQTFTSFPKVSPPQPFRPSYQVSLKPAQSKDYVHATWTGLHPSVSSPEIRSAEANLRKVEKSPPLYHSTIKISPLSENKKDSLITPRINNSTAVEERHPSPTFLKENKVPAKLPHLRGKEMWVESLEETEKSSNKPQAPDTGSNIRKVKEAVKQQTLGQKSASAMLLEGQRPNHMKISTAVDTIKSSDAYFEKATEATIPSKEVRTVVSGDRAGGSASGEVTNFSKMIKESFPSLRKVGLPVEKNGIALGKVVDENSWDTYMKSSPAASARQEIRVETFAPPPPAPPPPPPAPPPPPPPPPPPVSVITSPPSIPRKSASSSHPPSLISMEDLENQKTRLKPPVVMAKHVAPMDVRDSLMAEIRNAGGLRALRKISSPANLQ